MRYSLAVEFHPLSIRKALIQVHQRSRILLWKTAIHVLYCRTRPPSHKVRIGESGSSIQADSYFQGVSFPSDKRDSPNFQFGDSRLVPILPTRSGRQGSRSGSAVSKLRRTKARRRIDERDLPSASQKQTGERETSHRMPFAGKGMRAQVHGAGKSARARKCMVLSCLLACAVHPFSESRGPG